MCDNISHSDTGPHYEVNNGVLDMAWNSTGKVS
jgi:hypothetical protein